MSKNEVYSLEELKKMPPNPNAWNSLSEYLMDCYFDGIDRQELSEEDRKEIANETIAKIFSRIGSIEYKEYIKTTARRVALKIVLSRRKSVTISLDTLMNESSDNTEYNGKAFKEFQNACSDIFKNSARWFESLERIQDALPELPKKDKDFALAYWHFP